MAAVRTVAELSEHLQIPVIDILLPCNYCYRFLSSIEKALFDFSNFLLFWKEGSAYGCCQNCIRHAARIEALCFYERTLLLEDAERETNKLLNDIYVRCSGCLRELSNSEKVTLKALKEPCIIVRGSIRGTCALCRLKI